MTTKRNLILKSCSLLCLWLTTAAPAWSLERGVAAKLEVTVLEDGEPKTGDAANLTAYVSIDGDTTPDTLADTSATELDSTKAPGVYVFDLTAAETNGKNLAFTGKSTTATAKVVPRFVATVPPNHSLGVIDALGTFYAATGGGRIWYVDDNDGTGDTGTLEAPFDTINAAVAVAVAGDTIRVLPGTYAAFSCSVDNIQFSGAGADNTLVTSSSARGATITGDGCIFRGLKIQSTDTDSDGVAFDASSTRGTLVEDCIIDGQWDGIYVPSTIGFTIRRCVVTGTFDGGFCSAAILMEAEQVTFSTDGSQTSQHARGLYCPSNFNGHFSNCRFSADRTGNGGSNDTCGITIQTGSQLGATFDNCNFYARAAHVSNTGKAAAVNLVSFPSQTKVVLRDCRTVASNLSTVTGTPPDPLPSVYDIDCGLASGFVDLVNCQTGGVYANATNLRDTSASVAAILVDTGTTLDDLVDDLETRLSSARAGYLDNLNTGVPLIDNAITAAKIATDAITAAKVAAGTITVSEAPNLDAAISSISAGTSPTILQSGTLTVSGGQTAPVLSAGSADNDAYNNQLMIIVDQSTSTQKDSIAITDYVGSTKTVTLARAPIFTIATGDLFYIVAAPPATVSGTVDANLLTVEGADATDTLLLDATFDAFIDGAPEYVTPPDETAIEAAAAAALTAYGPLKPTTAGRTLDVTTGGAAGIDWGNIENKTTSNDLSGTSVLGGGGGGGISLSDLFTANPDDWDNDPNTFGQLWANAAADATTAKNQATTAATQATTAATQSTAAAASAATAATQSTTAATQATGANTKAADIQGRLPATLDGGLMRSNATVVADAELIEDLAVALVTAGVGGAPISPLTWSQAWRFDSSGRITANNVVVENGDFDGVIAMEFKTALGNSRIYSIGAPTITPTTGVEPVLGTPSTDPTNTVVLVPINIKTAGGVGVPADVGTYTITVPILTTDSQNLSRKGILDRQ